MGYRKRIKPFRKEDLGNPDAMLMDLGSDIRTLEERLKRKKMKK